MTVDTETGEIADTINYEVHPVAALFPFIEGDAFREFVEDIRANGQREPVVLDDAGRLIDGRNRARACQALGIDVKESRYSGDDVESWIVSHNVHRRHLTTPQRSMIAARLATLKRGGVEGNSNASKTNRSIDPFVSESPSIDEAASQLNVSASSVKRARSIIESGDAEVIKAVESGEKSLHAGSQQVRKPPEKPKAPPRYGSRTKHVQVVRNIVTALEGLAVAADEITELDHTVTSEEAVHLMDDLFKATRSLNRIKTLLKERTK